MSLFILGFKCLWRQRSLMLFTSAGMAAVMGPLLLLYGFKFGVIEALLSELSSDPNYREIVLRGNSVIYPADIEKYRSWPEVAFVEPAIRTISARLEMTGPPPSVAELDAGVLPSGPRDPLLPRDMILSEGQVALSEQLAERLHAKVGDHVSGHNQRTVEGRSEDIDFDFTVAFVVDRRFAGGNRMYVPIGTLFKLETFLDGYEVPDMHIPGRPLLGRADTAESVRLYARSIEDVVTLNRRFAEGHFDVLSRSDEISGVLNLSRNLAAVFALIAVIGSLGFTVSLAANLLGNIAQQRKLLSLIRLMGASRLALLMFPWAQGLAVSLAGLGMSILLFETVAWLANARFAGMLPSGADVCRLEAVHFAAAFGVTLVVDALVVAWVGRTMLSITPAEVLHAE